MDFHSLPRKELQALCKKNKIPANMTNVAMADALKALEKVEGLDEFNNEPRSDPQESPERTINVEPRTACRTSTRRKPINVESESSQPMTRTRRAPRRTVAEEAEQENKDVNLLETPAMPTTRRREPAASAPRKMDEQLVEVAEDEKPLGPENNDVPETPAMQTSRRKATAVSTRKRTEAQKDEKSVQRVYGTRQSVRLLEKSMADLCLKEKKKVEAVKIEGLCEKTEEVEQKNDVPDEHLEKSEMQHLVQEDNKTNDHEVDNSVVSFQNLAQPLENGNELKNDLHEYNNSESMAEKGTDVVIIESSEILNAALTSDIEKELNDNQGSLIVEMSDDNSVFVMETIVNVPDEVSAEVMDSLTPEVCEAEGRSSEMNLKEDEQHDAATEENGNESIEVQENDNAAKIQAKAPPLPHVEYEKSESRKEGPESPRFTAQPEKCKEASDNLATEYENDGVNVIDAKDSDMIIHDQKSPFSCPLVSDSEVAGKFPLIDDDHVVQEEFIVAANEFLKTVDKSPTSLKLTSPYQTGTVISSPFSANTIQGQFPRPNESTTRKSSTKKQATIQKTIYSDINKENIDNSGRKVEPSKDKVKEDVEAEKKYEDISLRQLTKMVKEKLQIASKNNDGKNVSSKQVGTRPALQVLTENCKAAGETENKN